MSNQYALIIPSPHMAVQLTTEVFFSLLFVRGVGGRGGKNITSMSKTFKLIIDLLD